MNSFDRNITQRRKQVEGVGSMNSCNDDSYDTSSSLSLSGIAQSLPDLSKALLSNEVEELRSEIMKLRIDLEKTQNEVDNLNSENHSLQKIIITQKSKIEKLTLLCTSSCNTLSTKKSNKTSRKPKPTAAKIQSLLNDSYNELNISHEHTVENPICNEQVSDLSCTTPVVNTQSIANTEPSLLTKDPKNENERTSRLLIFSDVHTHMRNTLQKLVGPSFFVSSISKPGASTDKLLESSLELCKDFNKLDYVIIVCGNNDKNPLRVQSTLYFYLDKLAHTNVLLCDSNRGRYLSIIKLHEMFHHICSQFGHSVLVNIDYWVPNRSYYLILCRFILRNILHLKYKYNYIQYTKLHTAEINNTVSIGTQTDFSLKPRLLSIETQTDCLFRD